MDLREIHRWRTRYIGKPYKQRGTRDNVLVLYGVRHGTGIPKIFMVEEAPHFRPVGRFTKFHLRKITPANMNIFATRRYHETADSIHSSISIYDFLVTFSTQA